MLDKKIRNGLVNNHKGKLLRHAQHGLLSYAGHAQDCGLKAGNQMTTNCADQKTNNHYSTENVYEYNIYMVKQTTMDTGETLMMRESRSDVMSRVG